jgi:hypothetical protein
VVCGSLWLPFSISGRRRGGTANPGCALLNSFAKHLGRSSATNAEQGGALRLIRLRRSKAGMLFTALLCAPKLPIPSTSYVYLQIF